MSQRNIGVIGLGYVGLPLAVAFAEAGHHVTGVEVVASRVEALCAGESHVEDVPSERLRALGDLFEPTTRYARLARTDAVVICVPTPLTPNREPDLQPLLDSAASVSAVLQAGQLVVLESTTFPGTTRERLVPILEESGLRAGRDFHVAFSPERIDPGRTDFTLRTTPKIVGGLTEACGDAAEALYADVCDDVVRVATPEVAEMAKLLENIFRSVNIAMVNEMSLIAHRMGIDIWEVIDAAATKPYGFSRFDPGPGMGGHCLPVDPFYLSWRAREFDLAAEFIELAGKVNQQMPYHCAERIERALNDAGKPVRGSRILIVGVSYKPNVGDLRESPALKIIELLVAQGADVRYSDPHVPHLTAHGLASEPLDPSQLEEVDLAAIVTAHDGVDHAAIAAAAPVVVDFRGVLRRVAVPAIA